MLRRRLIKVYVTDAVYKLIVEEACARGETLSEFGGEAMGVRAGVLRERRLPDEMVLLEDVHDALREYNRAVALRREREDAQP